jgi:hypothetical protein
MPKVVRDAVVRVDGRSSGIYEFEIHRSCGTR